MKVAAGSRGMKALLDLIRHDWPRLESFLMEK